MNILFISGHYPPTTKGGGEVSTHELAKSLVKLGHTVVTLVEGDAGDTTLNGVVVKRRAFGLTEKPLIEILASKRIARRIAQEADLSTFDIIHAHDFRSALALSELLKVGIVALDKVVVTIRDYAAISGDTNYIVSDGSIPKHPASAKAAWMSYRVQEVGGIKKIGRFLQYMLNTTYRTAAFARISNRIYISHVQHREIEKFLPTSKHEQVIYNPVEASAVVESGQHTVVTYVGRLETYKGVGVLLEAWKTIHRHAPQAKLVLVGEGAQRDLYKSFVQEHGLGRAVEFRSFVPHDDIHTVYAESTVVVAPNLWIEPFGRTVAEAMGAGKIVLATDVGGPSEIISHNKTGYICKRNAAADLALALLEILTMDPQARARIGEEARLWVEANLNPTRIGNEYAAYYLQIARKAR